VASVDDPLNQKDKTHDQVLPVGLFVHASIQGIHLPTAAKIPRTGLRENNAVYIIKEDNTLEIRTVEVMKTGKDFAIIESGLNQGDEVCLSIMDGASSGMKVRLEEQEQTPAPAEEMVP